MPIKKFYIVGDGKVIDVGLRPSVVTIGLTYDLKAAARNLYKENKVEVIISGAEEGIQQFWERVKREDIRAVRDEKAYTVTELEAYVGMEPDWAYYSSASLMEQIYKGVSIMTGVEQRMGGVEKRMNGVDKNLGAMQQTFASVQNSLKGIDEKFGEMINRFGIFGEYVKALGEELDILPQRIADAIKKTE